MRLIALDVVSLDELGDRGLALVGDAAGLVEPRQQVIQNTQAQRVVGDFHPLDTELREHRRKYGESAR